MKIEVINVKGANKVGNSLLPIKEAGLKPK